MSNIFGSYNEWDRLTDVIVGRVENARFPSWDKILKNTIPEEARGDYELIFNLRGQPIPDEIFNEANSNLEKFIDILTSEGVNIRRPSIADFSQPFGTPEWQVESGVSCANPRDVLLVIGGLIIECPMADRGRYFELFPYREILQELHQSGFKWISAPRPILADDTYTDTGHFSINNNEPLFDAADFVRCGNTIIGQLSHVTNQKGVDWLQSILGNEIDIKIITSRCPGALHIDTTIMPLAEETLLLNPEFVDMGEIKSLFPKWKLIIAPKPNSFYTSVGGYRIVSDWMSMNILSIDEKTIVIEEKQSNLAKTLRENGFDVILCPFESYYILGGSFHCSTLDLSRKPNNG